MARIKFSGALLMKLDPDTIQRLKEHVITPDNQGNELIRLSDDDLHVTLTSAKNARPFAETISTQLPQDLEYPEILISGYRFCYRPQQNKISYVAFLENQDEFKAFVDGVYNKMGLQNPEPDRLYHITMANNVAKADGDSANPFASIGDINQSDWEPSSSQYQVWFDLDGVLADFEGRLQDNKYIVKARKELDDLIDSEFPEFAGLPVDILKVRIKEAAIGNRDIKKLKKTFYAYNNLVYAMADKPGFFESLDLLPGSIEMLDAAKQVTGRLPNILTAPIGDENDPANHCVHEKKKWCQEKLAGKYNHIEVTLEKGRVVKSKYDILIDDRKKYLDKFTLAGGTAILHKTPSQSNPDSWKATIEQLKRICTVKEGVKFIKDFAGFKNTKINQEV